MIEWGFLSYVCFVVLFFQNHELWKLQKSSTFHRNREGGMKLSFKVEGKMGRMQTKSEIISARSFKDLCIFLLLRFRLTCLYPNLPLPYLEMKNDRAALHWRNIWNIWKWKMIVALHWRIIWNIWNSCRLPSNRTSLF